jgi:hypothetical protein
MPARACAHRRQQLPRHPQAAFCSSGPPRARSTTTSRASTACATAASRLDLPIPAGLSNTSRGPRPPACLEAGPRARPARLRDRATRRASRRPYRPTAAAATRGAKDGGGIHDCARAHPPPRPVTCPPSTGRRAHNRCVGSWRAAANRASRRLDRSRERRVVETATASSAITPHMRATVRTVITSIALYAHRLDCGPCAP